MFLCSETLLFLIFYDKKILPFRADCENWTGQGGHGWRPGGEPCEGITGVVACDSNPGHHLLSPPANRCPNACGLDHHAGNLVVNGGFEDPAIGEVDCQGGHDSSFRGDDHCQYKCVLFFRLSLMLSLSVAVFCAVLLMPTAYLLRHPQQSSAH